MSGRNAFLVQPRWLVGHGIVVVLFATFVLLGRWQLIVSDEKHFSLQNFGYALQWWIFAVFGVFLWLRILRDYRRRQFEAPEPLPVGPPPALSAIDSVPYRRYLMPTSAEITARTADPELTAYNAYLTELDDPGEQKRMLQ